MVPILYEHSETAFTSNGLGRLADAISCRVTEEINGIYELELVYPITGRHYNDLKAGRIIYATHDDTKTPQAFDIYQRRAPLNGQVTFKARHVSYRLNNIILKPIAATSCTSLFYEIGLAKNNVNSNPFTYQCTVTAAKDIETNRPMSVRSLLCGTDALSVPQNFDGEYRWDMFEVHFDVRRGSDTGITLRRGKNITELTHDLNAGQTCTAIIPYWLSNDGAELVTLEGYYVGESNPEKIGLLDLSHSFDTPPELEDLEAEAQKALETANDPEESITVRFYELWQAKEFEQYTALQRASLGDTVQVIYTDMGLNTSLRVVKVVYDTLMDRFESMELGKPKENYGTVLQRQFQDAVKALIPSESALNEAIALATEMIRKGTGGHVVINTDADGRPYEILVMDDPDINKAVNVMRINMGGIGFSQDGYDPEKFTSAWTLDGKFVADFITAGTFNANLIKTGTLADNKGVTSIDLTTGQGYIGLLNLRTLQTYDYAQGKYVTISRLYSDGHPYLLGTANLPAEGTNTKAGFVFRSTGEFNLGDGSQYIQFRRVWDSSTGSYKWQLDLSITSFTIGALTAASATVGGSSVVTQSGLDTAIDGKLNEWDISGAVQDVVSTLDIVTNEDLTDAVSDAMAEYDPDLSAYLTKKEASFTYATASGLPSAIDGQLANWDFSDAINDAIGDYGFVTNTDLKGAVSDAMADYDPDLSGYLKTSDASATYLTKSDAQSTYLPIANASNLQYIHYDAEVGLRVSSTKANAGYDNSNPYSFLTTSGYAALMWKDKPRLRIGDGLLTIYNATEGTPSKRVELDGNNLNFYKPDGTTVAAYYGAKGMMVNEANIGGFNVDSDKFYTNWIYADRYHCFSVNIIKPVNMNTDVIEAYDFYSQSGSHTQSEMASDTKNLVSFWIDAGGDAEFREFKAGAHSRTDDSIGGKYSDSNLANRDYIEIIKSQFGAGLFSYKGTMRLGNLYVGSSSTKFFDLTPTAGPTLTFVDAMYDAINNKYTYEVHTSYQSSKRYKNHVRNMTIDEARAVLGITPVIFKFKIGYIQEGDREENKEIPGFYAEDVEKNIERGVYYNGQGQVENWMPERLIPHLLRVIQDHEGRESQLEAKVASLEERLARLESLLV